MRTPPCALGIAVVLAGAGCGNVVTEQRLEASASGPSTGSGEGATSATSEVANGAGTSDAATGAGGSDGGGGGANVGGVDESGASASTASSTSAMSSSGSGGVEPPISACFPGVTGDFADDRSLAAWDLAHGVEIDRGRAVVGVDVADLGLLSAAATREEPCFLSFRVGALEPGGDFDAYVLARPTSKRELIDVDVNVDGSHVRLYWRGGASEIESHPRTGGDRFLLILGDAEADLYQADGDDASWRHVDGATFPPLTPEVELAIVHYPDLPAFWIDEVNVLPPPLVTTFPGAR